MMCLLRVKLASDLVAANMFNKKVENSILDGAGRCLMSFFSHSKLLKTTESGGLEMGTWVTSSGNSLSTRLAEICRALQSSFQAMERDMCSQIGQC